MRQLEKKDYILGIAEMMIDYARDEVGYKLRKIILDNYDYIKETQTCDYLKKVYEFIKDNNYASNQKFVVLLLTKVQVL